LPPAKGAIPETELQKHLAERVRNFAFDTGFVLPRLTCRKRLGAPNFGFKPHATLRCVVNCRWFKNHKTPVFGYHFLEQRRSAFFGSPAL